MGDDVSMKVYIVINVTQFDYAADERLIMGVYETEQAAEDFIRDRHQTYRSWDEVHEYEVIGTHDNEYQATDRLRRST